jgi:hypothetical protein
VSRRQLLSTLELADYFGLTLDALRKRLKRNEVEVPIARTYGRTHMYDPKVVGRMLGLKPVRKEQ